MSFKLWSPASIVHRLKRLREGSPIVIYHEFHKPPYGGGNQFLLALKGQWESQGFDVGSNRVGAATRAVLFNSYNFDFEKLRAIDRGRVRLVHRVDGPLSAYRGRDDGTDEKIWKVNHDLAHATVFQSQYSLDAHLKMGLEFNNPVVIPNAVDPRMFFPEKTKMVRSRVRLIATAWSDNPRKGADTYRWLDENLDHSRFEFVFVGRINVPLARSRVIPPVPSEQLAALLRDSDIYVTASENDPCSNALIEALSCGLPAIYLKSGGHPELVKDAGLGFEQPREIPALVEEIMRDYEDYRVAIDVPKIEKVAQKYLEVLGFSASC